MYTQVGTCPRCGAPIYSPSVWMSILPPPSIPSCSCFPQAQTVTYTTHTIKKEEPCSQARPS